MIGIGSRADRGINPWLLGQDRETTGVAEPDGSSVPPEPTGPLVAQHGRGAPQPTAGLPIRSDSGMAQPRLWVVGTHGGAGESCVASLDPTWAAADHSYPDPSRSAAVVLTCRSHVSGLLAAQQAAIQWASGSLPGLRLLGLIVVADSPGRSPKPVRDLAQLVTGGLAQGWTLPWSEAWRLGESPQPTELPRPFRRLAAELNQVLKSTPRFSQNLVADPEFPALEGNHRAQS